MEHENRVLTQKLDIQWEPEKIFPFFLEGEYPFFLDSGFFHPEIGRYFFMGKDPYMTFKSRKDKITIIKKDNVSQKQGNPIDILDDILNEYKCSPVDSSYPPFQNGAVGYLAYDLGWHMEVLPNKAENDIDLPESYFSFYDCVLAYDRLEEKCYLFSTGLPIKGRVAEKRAKDKLKEISAQLYAFIKNPKEIIKDSNTHENKVPELKSHFTKEEYCKAVQKAKDYISAGDIYQVNMTQRFETKSLVSPWELYCRLRKINPAPFAAYLDLGEGVIVSASPERFIKIDGNFIETRPIKGTRPRMDDNEFNEKMKNELLNSEKDRAELVMIVDLERNDLGRVCEFGTVKVEELFRLETYHHMAFLFYTT